MKYLFHKRVQPFVFLYAEMIETDQVGEEVQNVGYDVRAEDVVARPILQVRIY